MSVSIDESLSTGTLSGSIADLVSTSGEQTIPLPQFLNEDYGVIGRTVSTKLEPNTSGKFHFWMSRVSAEAGQIEIGNIVAAKSDDNSDVTFGSVTEMRAYSDVDSFISDYLSHNFGRAEIDVPTDISEVVVVTCAVIRNLTSRTKPVARSRVFFPSALGIQYAYGIVDTVGTSVFSGAAIPIGIFENGDGTTAPISVDEDFLIGPEGAHLNVSGISGLASKTSAIQFTLKSVLSKSSKNVAVVMFNVKSKDLLYIDQPNPKLTTEQWSTDAYNSMSVPAEPFGNARFFAPANNDGIGTQSLRTLATEKFMWDLNMMYRDVPSMFNSMDWDDKIENAWYIIQERIQTSQYLSYAQMLTGLNGIITTAGNNQWPLGVNLATWQKLRSHLNRFPAAYRGLIRTAGQGTDIPWNELQNGGVYVIDIQMLSDRGQKLVFSRAMRSISNKLEDENNDLDAIVVFVDELNKFAPSGHERTPLKSRIIDITARGRSLGLVLFGAEQFASSVDKEVIENSSTYLFGRTETNELRSPNYSAFSDEIKTKLTMLAQGTVLVKFPKFAQPIFVKFPYPPCLPGDKYNPGDGEAS